MSLNKNKQELQSSDSTQYFSSVTISRFQLNLLLQMQFNWIVPSALVSDPIKIKHLPCSLAELLLLGFFLL